MREITLLFYNELTLVERWLAAYLFHCFFKKDFCCLVQIVNIKMVVLYEKFETLLVLKLLILLKWTYKVFFPTCSYRLA